MNFFDVIADVLLIFGYAIHQPELAELIFLSAYCAVSSVNNFTGWSS